MEYWDIMTHDYTNALSATQSKMQILTTYSLFYPSLKEEEDKGVLEEKKKKKKQL